MWLQIRVYIITLLIALFASMSIYAYILSVRLDNANMRLAVIENDSEQHKVKIVEVEKKIDVIKWKVKEDIRYVYTYEYDDNKSSCANAIDLIRDNF